MVVVALGLAFLVGALFPVSLHLNHAPSSPGSLRPAYTWPSLLCVKRLPTQTSWAFGFQFSLFLKKKKKKKQQKTNS
jgi:hypothetical protein